MFNLIVVCFSFFTSVYSINISSLSGDINLGDYQGKKILIVNTASKSKYADQYVSLEQLYQRYKDSLVIIAIPCSDFGNEPDDDSTIQNFVNANYNIHFLLASKTAATGDSAHALFKWLTRQEQNGIANTLIKDDFQKYLLDENGSIIGIFNSSVDPMGDEMLSAFGSGTPQNQ